MSNNKVSIIIPVYNVEKYLKRCVESVINQTYHNLDIILIDDGSTDNSPSICDNYLNVDKRIKVIHQENAGLSAARNAGISIVKGKYIMFVDSDDWIDNNAVSLLVSRMESNPDADMCCFNMAKTDGYTSIPLRCNSRFFEIVGRDNIIQDACLGLNIKASACSKIYRADFIINNNLKFVLGVINEDSIFTLTSVLYSNKVIFENTVLYFVYSNDLSISRNIKELNITSLFSVIDNVKSAYLKLNLLDKYEPYIYASWIKLSLYTLVQAAYRLNLNTFLYYYSILGKSEFANVKIGDYVALYSKKMKYLYRLSFYPKLFYSFIRILKTIGLKMQ